MLPDQDNVTGEEDTTEAFAGDNNVGADEKFPEEKLVCQLSQVPVLLHKSVVYIEISLSASAGKFVFGRTVKITVRWLPDMEVEQLTNVIVFPP
jgi:hypothetical protein